MSVQDTHGLAGEQAFVALYHDGHTFLDRPFDFNEVFDVQDGGHRNLLDDPLVHLKHELLAAPEDQGVLRDHDPLVRPVDPERDAGHHAALDRQGGVRDCHFDRKGSRGSIGLGDEREHAAPRLELRKAVEGRGDGITDLNMTHVAFRKRDFDLHARQVDHLDDRSAFFHPLADLRKFLRNPSIERRDDSGFVQGVSDLPDVGAQLRQAFFQRGFLGQGVIEVFLRDEFPFEEDADPAQILFGSLIAGAGLPIEGRGRIEPDLQRIRAQTRQQLPALDLHAFFRGKGLDQPLDFAGHDASFPRFDGPDQRGGLLHFLLKDRGDAYRRRRRTRRRRRGLLFVTCLECDQAQDHGKEPAGLGEPLMKWVQNRHNDKRQRSR